MRWKTIWYCDVRLCSRDLIIKVSRCHLHGNCCQCSFCRHYETQTFHMTKYTALLFMNEVNKLQKQFPWEHHQIQVWLERLRSENAPAASWLRILLSHIGSQVKPVLLRSHGQMTLKIRVKVKGITCDTPFGASDDLWQIWKGSIEDCRRYRRDTIFQVNAERHWKY